MLVALRGLVQIGRQQAIRLDPGLIEKFEPPGRTRGEHQEGAR